MELVRNDVNIVRVKTKQEMKDFIHVTDDIYCNCPQYVPDWEQDLVDFFVPEKNPGLDFSDVQAFVAYRDEIAVGRIVGIINHRANERWQSKNVRFSMIEFIDDPIVSKALIEAVEEWGKEKGMDTLQGPMGISDFDKEGMLIEDFDLEGSMNTYYNPEYYPTHMEQLGMEKETDWLQIRINIPQEVPAKYARVAQYAREQIGLRVVKKTAEEILSGYGREMFSLLNEAYKPIFGYSKLSGKQVDEFLKKYISLIDLQLLPIILNDKDEMVGLAVTMGSLNKALQKSKGKMWPFGWWHMLKSLKWKKEDHAEMLLIAVRPDYQGLGVNALFFDDLIPIYNKCGFTWAETGPQLENNMRELTQWKPLKPLFVKRRRCYTKKIEE